MDYKIDIGKKDPLKKSVESTDRITRSIGAKLHNSIESILLAFVVAIEIVMNFITFSLSGQLTPEDVLFILTECFTTVLVFYLFIAPGKRGRQSLQSFTDAFDDWVEACRQLRTGKLLSAFRKYCQEKSAKDAEEEREARLERLENLYVSKEEFDEYKKKSKKDLMKMQRKY